MAQLLTVRLNKSDHQPLGFRLQGGKDFGTPLVVQKVCVKLSIRVTICTKGLPNNDLSFKISVTVNLNFCRYLPEIL